MKKVVPPLCRQTLSATVATLALLLFIPASHAAEAAPSPSSSGVAHWMETITTTQATLGGLLLFALALCVVVLGRDWFIRRQMKDLTVELDATRQRLTETNHELDDTRQQLTDTGTLNNTIHHEAGVGIFKISLSGQCIELNAAMQEMSGLYLKKAQKEGLEFAIHPDDVNRFKSCWSRFTQHNDPFCERFRFKRSKGRDVHVHCVATRVLNKRKDAEYYIGWVTDITPFHEREEQIQAVTSRYRNFVGETIEGYYQLAPERPIQLGSTPEKTACNIMERMRLVDCNETFAAMYGTSPEELIGKAINELNGGCGPFKNTESMERFVAGGMSDIGTESVRQDPSGNRLNFVNNVVGLIEENKIVGIYGSQRNTSQQKREKAELQSQVQFMHRILNAVPADICVKDTRCRYLYANRKLAERTGIPAEDWIGKTIFEVLPATPRTHDRDAVEAMRSRKIARSESSFEIHGQTGWLETVHAPLVSEDELVDGIVAYSLDITERKQREEEQLRQSNRLQERLNERTEELTLSRSEHGETATALNEAIQALKVAEADHATHTRRLELNMEERARAEERLRESETHLLKRQKELETQLEDRLVKLTEETEQRRKWEQLLSIKEDALREIETHAQQIEEQLSNQTTLKREALADLAESRAAYEEVNQRIASIEHEHKLSVETLESEHQHRFREEHQLHKTAERKRKKAESALLQSQEQIKTQAKRHSEILAEEVTKREEAGEKLNLTLDELDTLKQQFTVRITEATTVLKRELSQKQIHEKAMREHEKELKHTIESLEEQLRQKGVDLQQAIEAREKSASEHQDAQQRLNELREQHEAVLAEEAQKMEAGMAELRAGEAALKQRIEALEQERDQLALELKHLNTERQALVKAQGELKDALAEQRADSERIQQQAEEQIAQNAGFYEQSLSDAQERENDLRSQSEELTSRIHELEAQIHDQSAALENEQTAHHEAVEQRVQLEAALEALRREHTLALEGEQRKMEHCIVENEQGADRLKQQICALEKERDQLSEELQQLSYRQNLLENERDELQLSVEREQQKVEHSIHENEQDANRLNHQISGLEKERDALTGELQLLYTKHNQLEIERAELQQALDERNDDYDCLELQIEERINAGTQALEHEIAEREANEARLNQRAQQLDAGVKQLERELKAKTEAYENEVRERDIAFFAKHQAEETAEQTRKKQEKAIKQERIKLEQLQQEMQNEKAKFENRIGQLQQERSALAEELELRNQEQHTLSTEQQELKQALNDLQQQIKTVELAKNEVIEQKNQTLEAHLAELDEIEQRNRELAEEQQQHIDKLQASVTRLKEEIAAETTRRGEIQSDCSQLEEQLKTAQQALAALQKQHQTEQQEQNLRFKEHEENLQQQMEQQLVMIEEREADLVEARSRCKETEDRIYELETIAEKLQQDYQNELKEARINLEKQTQTIDELNDRIQQVLDPVEGSIQRINLTGNLLPQQQHEVETISLQCRKLAEIAECSSELSHGMSETQPLQLDQCQLHKLINRMEEQYAPRAETKKLFFAVSYAHQQAKHGLPELVKTDSEKIEKVISMLLDYALEHTHKGRLGLHASCKNRDDALARISFDMAYTGETHPDPVLDQLFGQADAAPGEEQPHCMELDIVRQFIDLLDGEVRIKYRDGGVTVITTELPVLEVGEQEHETSAGAA